MKEVNSSISAKPTGSRSEGIAVVFAGGGAKGAYGMGVLKALKSFDVKYDAVAGTSVGGLLALIFATDTIEIGEKIWGEISYNTSYPLRSDKLKRLPKPFIKALGLSVVVLNLIWARLHGFPTLHPNVISHLAALVSIDLPALICYMPLMLIALCSGALNPLVLLPWLAILVCFHLAGAFFLRAGTQQGAYAFAYTLGMAWAPIALALTESVPVDRDLARWIGEFSFFLFVSVLAIVLGTLYSLFRYVVGPHRTILESAPLRGHIASILAAKKSEMLPCFVTTAHVTEAFDPDKGRWHTYDQDHDGAAKRWGGVAAGPGALLVSEIYPD